MPGCSVVGCKTRREKGLTIRLHRFPANAIRRKHWQENVGRKGWIPKKNSLICQAHFDDDQFEKNRTDGKRNLKFNAVPTIFPHGRHLRKPVKRTYVAHNSVLKLKIPERVTADHNYCAKDLPPPERPRRPGRARSPLKLEFDKSSYPWLRKSTTKNKNAKKSNYKSVAHMDSQNLGNIDAQHLAHIDNVDHTYSDTQNLIHAENQNSENPVQTDNKCGEERHSLSRPNSESNSQIIEELKSSLRKSEKKCERLIKEREILTAAFKKFFAEDQLKALATGGLHGVEWTSETIKKTMELKSICGRKGYRYLLAKNYPFPSERTLQRRIRQEKKDKEKKAVDEKAKIEERSEPGTQNVDGAHVSPPSSDMVVLRLLDSENGTVQDLACNDENVLALFGITRPIGDGQIVPESATNGRGETTDQILPDELIKICQSEEFLQTNSEGMTFEIGDIMTNNHNVLLGTRQQQQQANNGTSISGIQQQNSVSCSGVLPVELQQPTLVHSTDSPVTNMVSSSDSLSPNIDAETEVVVTDCLEPNGPLVEVLTIPYMMESSIVDSASHEAVYASIQDQCNNMLQQDPTHS